MCHPIDNKTQTSLVVRKGGQKKGEREGERGVG